MELAAPDIFGQNSRVPMKNATQVKINSRGLVLQLLSTFPAKMCIFGPLKTIAPVKWLAQWSDAKRRGPRLEPCGTPWERQNDWWCGLKGLVFFCFVFLMKPRFSWKLQPSEGNTSKNWMKITPFNWSHSSGWRRHDDLTDLNFPTSPIQQKLQIVLKCEYWVVICLSRLTGDQFQGVPGSPLRLSSSSIHHHVVHLCSSFARTQTQLFKFFPPLCKIYCCLYWTWLFFF